MITLYLKNAEGRIVAYRDEDDHEWFDPYGGSFTRTEQEGLTACAEGRIDRGLRLVVRFRAARQERAA